MAMGTSSYLHSQQQVLFLAGIHICAIRNQIILLWKIHW